MLIKFSLYYINLIYLCVLEKKKIKNKLFKKVLVFNFQKVFFKITYTTESKYLKVKIN